MKLPLEPEQGGGPVMSTGQEAPLRSGGEMRGMDRKEGESVRGTQWEDLDSPQSAVF